MDPVLASIPRRVLAYFVDILVAFVAAAALQALLLPLNPLLSDASVSGAGLHAWATLTVTIPLILYFGAFWASRAAASPGMLLLRLRVGADDGQRVPMTRALLRALVLLVPFELNHAVLSYPTPIWADPSPSFRSGFVVVYALLGTYLLATMRTPRRQGPHDLVARTVVIQRWLYAPPTLRD